MIRQTPGNAAIAYSSQNSSARSIYCEASSKAATSRVDRVAVDDDGVVRLDRAGVCGGVHLVEQQTSLVDLPEMDQRDGAPLPAAQLEPHVAVLAADPLSRPAEVPGRGVVVRLQRAEPALGRREWPCARLSRLALEQPLGAENQPLPTAFCSRTLPYSCASCTATMAARTLFPAAT